jgi:hypothetical protein
MASASYASTSNTDFLTIVMAEHNIILWDLLHMPPPQTLISSLLLWQKENMKYDGTTILVLSHSTVEVQVSYIIMSPQPFFPALGLFHLLRVTREVVLLH